MDDFTAFGGQTHEIQGSLSEALANMAVLKNVPLTPEEREEAAGVLSQMDCAQVHELTGLDGLAARSWAVNAHLDMIAVARLMGIVRDIEGKDDINDPVVTAVTQEIVARLDAGLASRECVHWPNLAVLAMTHYAGKSRGPTVEVREDGTVCTRWWMGVNFHRDPKEGPANIVEKDLLRVAEYWVKGQLHRPPTDGPAIILTDDRNDGRGPVRIEEYRVDGQLHRPHEDGPAMYYTHYRKFDLSGAEYFEHGKWHRPSELGPAVTHWDRGGEPVMELYFENGEHHRDPKDGPAWWHIRDSRTDRTGERPCTEIRYYVRGQPHRDEKDGPALIKRDNETGVLLTEEYWRNGNYHREDGPAIIERSPDGIVIYEAYRRAGGFRDGSEGPSTIHYDPQGRRLAEAWFTGKDSRRRDASEGPGHIGFDRSTGRVRAEFYVDDQYRPAREGPAAVTRDREGNVLWEEFWDGERMHVKELEPMQAEVSAHG